MEGVDYFEHDADIGVIGCGGCVGQAFERGAWRFCGEGVREGVSPVNPSIG